MSKESQARERDAVTIQNPTRRNRNIGTAKQGHGLNNRMVVPQRWDAPFYTTLRGAIAVARGKWTFLVEPARTPFVHACTIDDVAHVLAMAPPKDVAAIDLIVLRQPTRKQRMLEPVWGRL